MINIYHAKICTKPITDRLPTANEVILVIYSETNLYEVLEISSTANATVIKSAYRKLARKYHPDLNGGDEFCVRKFKQITEAYEILSDAEKKKNYDLLKGFYSHDDSPSKRKQASKAYKDVEHSQKKNYTDNDSKSDNFKNQAFSNIFNDILEGFKTTTSKEFKTKPQPPERGEDVYTDLTITMTEAIHGTTRTINILHTEKCPHCESRKFVNDAKCQMCNGLGEQSIHKKISVKIPANVKHGSKIRIANEGNRGYNGGKNGDLYLNIKIENNSIFRYEGQNVFCTIPITPAEAALGASIMIPTPDGTVSMKILPKTTSGQKFRLSSQGLTDKNGKKGDMIVTVMIEMPKNLSDKETELYEQLNKLTKEDIRRDLFNGI